jgi:hypothetical protein
MDILILKGRWPGIDNGDLVWFDLDHPDFLFTLPQLKSISTVELDAQVADGSIHSVRTK